MAWKAVSTNVEMIDRVSAVAFAKKHFDLPHSATDRKLREENLKRLKAILRDGRAIQFNWATVEYKGVLYRMNGRHSSQAIMEVGDEIMNDRLCFVVARYTADTEADMVDLFRQIDARWSGRNADEVAGAFIGFVPDLSECKDVKVMKVLAQGIAWYRRKVRDESVPTDDDIFIYFQESGLTDFFKWAYKILKNRVELKRVEMVAAIYATYAHSPDEAKVFWHEICLGVENFADNKSPGGMLINEIVDARTDSSNKEFPYGGVYYSKGVKAWNAHVAGQTTVNLRVSPTAPKLYPEPHTANKYQVVSA